MRDFMDGLEILLERLAALACAALVVFVVFAFGLLFMLAVWKSVLGRAAGRPARTARNGPGKSRRINGLPPRARAERRKGESIMRSVATVVFVFAFVFLAGGAAAQTLRSPVNSEVAGHCLRLANNAAAADAGAFQTDILEAAGADRVRARFVVSNRCRVAVRVMGGLRFDGSEIEQRGRIEVLALQDDPGAQYWDDATVAGRAFMPSFVVPAAGRTEVSVLVVLDGAVTSSAVAVVVAPAAQYGPVFTRGGSRQVWYRFPDDVTGWCAHYEDRRCGEY